MCDEVLKRMSGYFDAIYAEHGARSTAAAVRAVADDMLFRWFVDLPLDAEGFDASTYSKNQARLFAHEVAELFFYEVVERARNHGWVSNDHFSVDATLVEAWAYMKSFKPKRTDQGPGSGNKWADFKGKKRCNTRHESTTDKEAKLLRKGLNKEARLCFAGHARCLMSRCFAGKI